MISTELSAASLSPAISFRGVHMLFPSLTTRPVHALRGLDLDVLRGSILGLLGPNGCGKTTAISCLLGLLQPQCGELHVDGQPLKPARWQTAGRYGVLLEDTRLPAFLSVRRALHLIGALRGLSRQACKQEFERVVQEVAIADLLTRKVHVLSKGQARKVGLAAALIGDPPFLILDEPSAGLDVAARVDFEQRLHSLKDGRRTVLIASHLLSDIENSCTHVAIMQAGAVRCYGETSALLNKARQGETQSLVYISSTRQPELEAAGLTSETSRYAGLVQVLTELPDAELLQRLLQLGITPKRLEPKTDLVSMYLDLTSSEKKDANPA